MWNSKFPRDDEFCFLEFVKLESGDIFGLSDDLFAEEREKANLVEGGNNHKSNKKTTNETVNSKKLLKKYQMMNAASDNDDDDDDDDADGDDYVDGKAKSRLVVEEEKNNDCNSVANIHLISGASHLTECYVIDRDYYFKSMKSNLNNDKELIGRLLNELVSKCLFFF